MRFWASKKSNTKTSTLKSIILEGVITPYTLVTSSRIKYLRITIHRDGSLRVTTPSHLKEEKVEKCIQEKSEWVLSKLAYYKSLPTTKTKEEMHQEYLLHKEAALVLVSKKLSQLNSFYNFKYNNIRIKNHTTLWGSCSRKGNLNFNYKILQLPENLADYIITHELCHLKEFNHGVHFWDLVAKMIPNHKELRKELKFTGMKSQ